jgi:hypothetical protein
MARIALFFLLSVLSAANTGLAAGAYDLRFDPAVTYRNQLQFRLPSPRARGGIFERLVAPDKIQASMTPDFVAAMILYRLALEEDVQPGQAPAIPWLLDQTPDAFQRAWVGPGGDLVAKVGKRVFQHSTGNYRANWFRQLNCQLIRWLDGNSEVRLSCEDGREPTIRIPGGGTILIDGVQYGRVFGGVGQ